MRVAPFSFIVYSLVTVFCFISCTSVRGWVTRDTHCFLATGAVAGWVWLRAKPWACGVVFCFEIDILGVFRGFWASPRPYVENGLCFYSLSRRLRFHLPLGRQRPESFRYVV